MQATMQLELCWGKGETIFRAIYYASRILNEAQKKYTTTEKEMLVVVYSCDKFKSYTLGAKAIFLRIMWLLDIS